jgi:NAD(P)-binding Rossmann-like domain
MGICCLNFGRRPKPLSETDLAPSSTTATMDADQAPPHVERHDTPMEEAEGREEFTLKDETVENLRPIKVIVVGAGLCGILAAIRIPERMRNVELVVYEKSEKVGGVWWLSKYPGVACDVPCE